MEVETWHQVDGCGITVMEEYALMKVDHGVDSTGLGQYCWVPAFNQDMGSVWNQHVRYFWKEQLLYDMG
jgi:hypothetical protein